MKSDLVQGRGEERSEENERGDGERALYVEAKTGYVPTFTVCRIMLILVPNIGMQSSLHEFRGEWTPWCGVAVSDMFTRLACLQGEA